MTSGPKVSVRLVRFLLRSDSQPPSNCALSRRMPGVFVQRKWPRGVGNCFTSTPAASIDARADGRFPGLIFRVELRTDADFDVVATPKECHGSPSLAELSASNSAVSYKQTWDSAQMICAIEWRSLSAARRPSFSGQTRPQRNGPLTENWNGFGEYPAIIIENVTNRHVPSHVFD